MIQTILFLSVIVIEYFMPEMNYIEHSGQVTRISDHTIEVKIEKMDACSSCHAKGACQMTGSEEMLIEIPVENNPYIIGDTVKVTMHQATGNKAVFLAYILPFLLLISGLVISYTLSQSEGFSGLIAFSVLGIYFLILYFFRAKLSASFRFFVKSMD